MNNRERANLDRYITGNYGEDQFRAEDDGTNDWPDVHERLEYLRGELRAERISYLELNELQGLAQYIEPGDVELLEAAGVPEFAPEDESMGANSLEARYKLFDEDGEEQ